MKAQRARASVSLGCRLGSLALMAAILLGLNACGNTDPRECFSFPHLSSISPNATTAGGSEFTLTVNGNSFYVNSVVQWNGSTRPTTVISATELTAVITADDIANAGTAYVQVDTPLTPEGGNLYCSGESKSLQFTINP